MPFAQIELSSGRVVAVEGDLEAVEKALSDASRSGASRLAWFAEHEGAGSVGVNPAHVAAIRGGASDAPR